ncbi:ABC-type transporter ATP-binding protein EcsA [Salinivirga cyanobacteriivorans]|uniref:ABC-type transporter ATP-binding protein EcsA n=1 Tax=Salinivirga cyanobacteriivorans TaxID=1307839 RepID=A0A0S2HX35_9BACT|nr:ATP-binding cassette domain-containing protein [Salinivirga cyanobacteriivorans]ALO14380.1 ABC-type transporter ATP-binding protein EcsA [Salinivirga cyanobacteriivorans]
MIIIKSLTLKYGKKTVIDNLSVQFDANKIHGIVGLNGAGKTTLLNAIFRIKKPAAGHIYWNEAEISRKQISMLPTEPFFYDNITGKEYLDIFQEPNFELNKWNALFKLPLKEITDTYSTGMKKKLALMAVIKQNKPIMILDEPFNGLDLETTRIVRSILLQMKLQGKTIIITSHVMETLTNLCDKLYHLSEKNILEQADKSNFDTFEQSLFQNIEERNKTAFNDLFGQSEHN